MTARGTLRDAAGAAGLAVLWRFNLPVNSEAAARRASPGGHGSGWGPEPPEPAATRRGDCR